MNTVKLLNDSNLRPLPKKRFPFWNNSYLPVMLLAVLLGTILDLYFVGTGLYGYPLRPFPMFFSFNILFTFVVLPVGVLIFLRIMDVVNHWGRVGVVLLVSLLMPVFEKLAEMYGLFSHSPHWNHLYSFFGYFAFLMVMYFFYCWIEKRKR